MEDLKQHLQALHNELQSSKSLDPSTLEALKILAEDIRVHIDNSQHAVPSASNSSLSDRLEGLLNDFEVQHPRLTNIISQIAERLADMGI